jgi:hypothetical protein
MIDRFRKSKDELPHISKSDMWVEQLRFQLKDI